MGHGAAGQVVEIAKAKMEDLNADDPKATRIIEGTAHGHYYRAVIAPIPRARLGNRNMWELQGPAGTTGGKTSMAKHGKKYRETRQQIKHDATLGRSLEMVKGFSRAAFDETVEPTSGWGQPTPTSRSRTLVLPMGLERKCGSWFRQGDKAKKLNQPALAVGGEELARRYRGWLILTWLYYS